MVVFLFTFPERRAERAGRLTEKMAGAGLGKFSRLYDELYQSAFRLLRTFRPVRERVTIGEYNDHVEREHIARYEFAKAFCAGRTVADIACGTGYGTRMLAQVASLVHGYDKEPLCDNRLIDLENEAWADSYDVIVSFETIEHLANPEFFLQTAFRTARLLIISTPISEFKGYNPHHKQVWTLDQFQALLEKYFTCMYYYQVKESIEDRPNGPVRFVIAVGAPVALPSG